MHEAMGAFLCEIPATSGFSASFESSFLEIRIHYPVPLAENTLKKPKKKVPPSKVRRNRRRLMKFLEKPEVQSDLPLASHKRSGDGEGTPAPPSTTRPEPCAGKASHDVISLQFDPAHIVDSAMAPSLSLHMGEGEKDKEKGKEMESVNNKNSSKNEGMISEDNETGLDYGFGGPRKGSHIDKDGWSTPCRSDWGRPCSPTDYTWRPKLAAPATLKHPSPPPAPTLKMRRTRPRSALPRRMYSLFVQFVYPPTRFRTENL